jgi:4-hydroxy-4-methyl-2-oxoglutarate aldolase
MNSHNLDYFVELFFRCARDQPMNKPIVIREITRAHQNTIEALRGYGVSTIHEAQGRIGLLAANMRPIYQGSVIAGSAITVTLPPGDNLMIHVAVEVCKKGDVLVVSPTSPCTNGYFGELLATSLAARGVRGLIINAGCRDVRSLTKMRFPVWSLNVSAQGTVKETLGSVNVPIVCAGAAVRPGDVIVADDDGVVVVHHEDADEIAKASEARLEKEAKTRVQLAAGKLGLDIYNLRKKLADLGLEYI